MKEIRKAKIICTIGPATFSESAIARLINAGMDVARLNFSHGDYRDYKRLIKTIRKQSKKLNKPVTILQDLQGPKIRTGRLKSSSIKIKNGKMITVTTKKIFGDEKRISIPYKPLPQLLKKGNSILIDDGLLELKVISTTREEIRCRVVAGGVLKEHKGVNIPYVKREVHALTKKDIRDLKFGLKNNVDHIALSFVRSEHDIRVLKRRIPKNKKVCIIAKIEKPEAIDHLDQILQEVDGVMVARGDLAVETSTEAVPRLQKEIIYKCNRALKPVITATQMLESMVEHPRPTRAEASDVANAVIDGTDALMLSAETATGKYPIKAVEMMDRIIRDVESVHKLEGTHSFVDAYHHDGEHEIHVRATEKAACDIAQEVGAKLICCLTERGRSARILSEARPTQPIIAFTSDELTLKKLSLVWGVQAHLFKGLTKTRNLFKSIRRRLIQLGLVHCGDRIVITTGIFTHSPDTARVVKLHKI